MIKTLRSRWFALLIQGGLWLLLVLAIMHLGGQMPKFAEATGASESPRNPIPTGRIQALFGEATAANRPPPTNLVSPFFTRHFIPPVVPPPTTRKVELTYQGYFQLTDGPRMALVKVGDTFVSGAPGAKAVGNLFITDVTWQTLTLTNPAAQTNLLPVNRPQIVELPIP